MISFAARTADEGIEGVLSSRGDVSDVASMSSTNGVVKAEKDGLRDYAVVSA